MWAGFRWCWGICFRKGPTRPARWITSVVSSSHIPFVRAIEHGSSPFVYPCLLKSPDCKCLMLLHVDDILVVCNQSFLDVHLLKALKTKYKVSAEAIRSVGDSITFLKRRIVLEDWSKLFFSIIANILTNCLSWWMWRKRVNPSILPLMHKCWKLCKVLSLKLRRLVHTVVQLAFCLIYLVTWCNVSGWSGTLLNEWANLHWKLGLNLVSICWVARTMDWFIIEVISMVLTYFGRHSQIQTGLQIKAHVRVFLHVAWWWTISYWILEVEIKVLLHYPQLKLEHMQQPQERVVLCSSFLLEVEVSIKLLIDKSACRYILSCAGCGRVRHLPSVDAARSGEKRASGRWVGAVSSSVHVADIGTKRLSVPTMKYLMYKLGVYDSASSKLVGFEEASNKHVKQTETNFKWSE